MNPIIRGRILRGIAVLVVVVLTIVGVRYLFPLLYPLLLAWLFAYAMNPLVRLLQKRLHFPRWLAVSLSLLVYFGGVITILSLLITRLVQETISLMDSFNDHIDSWRTMFVGWTKNDRIQSIIDQINSFLQQGQPQGPLNDNLNQTTQNLTGMVSNIVTSILNYVLNFLTALPNFAWIMVVVVLSAFFISNSWERHNRMVSGWFPSNIRQPAAAIWSDLQKALFGYIKTQMILISITGLIVIVGLFILQVPSALLIGLLIGLVDLLPYLGVGIVMVPWAIYSLMSNDVGLGIGLSVVYVIVLIVRQLIEPKILASNVGLDPLATLISMFVGLKLFGALGLIIGPVTLVLVTALNRANVFRDLRNYIVNGKVR
ncbi:sporulation integral membrane protein YtvI [Paenibacillus campi]|uniref:sporulation integral membrane protein YtvI n=1 Tax=Paenibacillus campi TaxID=3106031 RepID=UPI002AFEA384|nr:sporulation integral membrane protein YtvI [Paenibacillus sp. SGZ-1014]